MATTTNGKGTANAFKRKPLEDHAEEQTVGSIVIPPANIFLVKAKIEGITPLMVRRFSQKKDGPGIHGGDEAKLNSKKDSPDEMTRKGRYIFRDSKGKELWDGFNALTIKACMISACTMVENLTKTDMKLSIYVESDGVDEDGTPLIKIDGTNGKPAVFTRHNGHCRTTSGVTYECYRPMYQPWTAEIRLRLNAHLVTVAQAVQLLTLGGQFCGIGEHRPSAPKSYTGTFGCFKVTEAVASR